MEKNSDWIVYDGTLVPADEPVAPAISRGLMYGDGAFETFRTYTGKTLFLQKHLDRLVVGLTALGISYPPAIEIQKLRLLVQKLLQKKDLLAQDAIVRLQVWRSGKRGYLPDANADSHFSITVSECPKKFKLPILATVGIKRIPSKSLPSDYKFSNGINYILAAKEAAQKDADDALMQTIDGQVSETTIGNIFWLKGDKIFTPSANCDLIPGITRKRVIEIVDNHGKWQIEEGKYGLNHIMKANAVFMCNSVRELLPAKQINDYVFDVENEIVNEIKKRFSTFRNNNLKSLK